MWSFWLFPPFLTLRVAPPLHYLQWMRNPISTKELVSVALGCGNAGGAPATPQQLAMLQQQTSTTPTYTPSTPDAADEDKNEGTGAAQNDVKMPPMGVRISMTIGGRKRQLEGNGKQPGGGQLLPRCHSSGLGRPSAGATLHTARLQVGGV